MIFMRNKAAGLLLAIAMALNGACGTADTSGTVDTTGNDARSALSGPEERASPNRGAWAGKGNTLSLTSQNDAWCPSGFSFDADHRLCESSADALGPFPAAMVDACGSAGGGTGCANPRWNKEFAEKLRGTGQCPKGTWLDTARAECTDGTNVFGPFSAAVVQACRKKGGGDVCDTMRWQREFVEAQDGGSSTWNERVLDYYSQKDNYDRVYRSVMGWYGTTENGCVAFMTTALRQSGMGIPQEGTSGDPYVSLRTASFGRYLANKGWTRVSDHNALRPGDVVFTVGNPGDDEHPLHTYMFQGWKDRVTKMGLVIDNQAFTHERDIFNYGSFHFSPFQYAMRSRD